jgi:hypothetical protein
MSDASNPAPSGLQQRPPGYAEWLTDLKARIHAAQQRAALAVNRELLLLYWELGRDILARQVEGSWGAGIVDQVSRDLRAAFPDMKGFSRSNLKYMRAFAQAWPDVAIGQQPVGQLPWGHNLVQMKAPEDGPTIGLLLCKSKNRVVAEYALRDTNKPIGVAEVQLIESLPKDLEASLPSIEQIERELGELEE